MNVKQVIVGAQKRIKSDTPKLDAEILLSSTLQQSTTWLKTWPDYVLTEAEEARYMEMLKRRINGEPIAYIVGERGFWTLSLKTDASTLIPRPETELLVEQALLLIDKNTPQSVLDLGTGTGAIALAIASERPEVMVTACDKNDAAVKLACENSQRNALTNVKILQSDWFSELENTSYNLIVSNPPYIDKNDPHLAQGDVSFEPDTALVSADEGYADIKIIASQARGFLIDNGVLMFEHGFEQGKKAREILQQLGYSEIKTVNDLAGLERVTMGRYFDNVN